jgi:hypothetical protein
MTLKEKLEFINEAFEKAELVNTLELQYESLVDTFYNHIQKEGLMSKNEFTAFYDKIESSELGYTEEDKIAYEENPDLYKGKLNTYQAYLYYCKI